MRVMVHLGIYHKSVLGLNFKDRSNENQKSLKTHNKWMRLYAFKSHYINTLFMQRALLGACLPC